MVTKDTIDLISAIIKETTSLKAANKLLQDVFSTEEISLIHEAIKENRDLLEISSQALASKEIDAESYILLCHRAIQVNPENVQYALSIPSEQERKTLYLSAVKLNGLVLRTLPEAQSDLTICAAAVEQNIFALEFVEEALRVLMCHENKQRYLEKNFMSHQYFSSEDKNCIKPFLEALQRVVLFDEQDIYDREIHDALAIYIQKKLAKGMHITSISTQQFHHLMQILKDNDVNQPMSMVVVGHNLPTTNKIARMSAEDICTLLETYTQINGVTLFGCGTANADKLEEEKIMISRTSMLNHGKAEPVGLLITQESNIRDVNKLLKVVGLNKAFVIVQKENDGLLNYYLLHICIKNKNVMSSTSSFLTEEESDEIRATFNKGNSLNRMIKKQTDISTLRTKDKPLSTMELSLINKYFRENVLDKSNTFRMQDKEHYPFLKGFVINEEECEQKLKPSLMQQLIMNIKSSHLISRPMTVKGFSNIINIDVKYQCFHVLPNICTPYSYYRHAHFFSPSADSMDRKALIMEHKKLREEVDSDEQTGKTLAKSIKVTINPSLRFA